MVDQNDAVAEQEHDASTERPTSSLAELALAVREAGPSVRTVRPASFGPRFWAAFTDGALIMLISLLCLAVTAVADAVAGPDKYAGIYLTYGYVMLVLMYSATEAYGSCTPGKSFVGVRVVRHDGRPATRGRRVVRWAVKQSPLFCLGAGLSLLPLADQGLSFFESLVPLVGLLIQVLALILTLGCFLVLTPGRRAVHDLLTGTAVFRDEDVVRDPGHAFRPLPVQVLPASALEQPVTSSA